MRVQVWFSSGNCASAQVSDPHGRWWTSPVMYLCLRAALSAQQDWEYAVGVPARVGRS